MLTEKIPVAALYYIRLVALFLWTVGALSAVYFAWETGTASAPASGQDLYLSEIKAKATREENLKNPPDFQLPPIKSGEEEGIPDRSLPLSIGEEEREKKKLPPYIGEKRGGELPDAYLPAVEGEREVINPQENRKGEPLSAPAGDAERRGSRSEPEGENKSTLPGLLPLR